MIFFQILTGVSITNTECWTIIFPWDPRRVDATAPQGRRVLLFLEFSLADAPNSDRSRTAVGMT